MKIREEDINELNNAIENFSLYFEADDFWTILDVLDDVIIIDCEEHNDEPSEYGKKLEHIRDRFYYDNIAEYDSKR